MVFVLPLSTIRPVNPLPFFLPFSSGTSITFGFSALILAHFHTVVALANKAVEQQRDIDGLKLVRHTLNPFRLKPQPSVLPHSTLTPEHIIVSALKSEPQPCHATVPQPLIPHSSAPAASPTCDTTCAQARGR